MSPWTYEAEAALLRTWRKSEAFSEKKMMSKKGQHEWVITQLEPVVVAAKSQGKSSKFSVVRKVSS